MVKNSTQSFIQVTTEIFSERFEGGDRNNFSDRDLLIYLKSFYDDIQFNESSRKNFDGAATQQVSTRPDCGWFATGDFLYFYISTFIDFTNIFRVFFKVF